MTTQGQNIFGNLLEDKLRSQDYHFTVHKLTLSQKKSLIESCLSQKGCFSEVIEISNIYNTDFSILMPYNQYKTGGISSLREMNNTVIFVHPPIENPNERDFHPQNYKKVDFLNKEYQPYSHNYDEKDNELVIEQLNKRLNKAWVTRENLFSRTKAILSNRTFSEIKNKSFLIIGCGGVGGLFAEFLIRAGATNLTLIDDDKVAISNLNRLAGSKSSWVNKSKVTQLKKYFEQINKNVVICEKEERFNEGFNLTPYDYVIMCADDPKTREVASQEAKKSNKSILSIGMELYDEATVKYTISWNDYKVDKNKISNNGYGQTQGSYLSVVSLITSLGFQLFLKKRVL